MGFSLDHVVIAVTDLDRAMADYRSLGFTVYPGGVHHGGVSHNALVVFADGSYFELIAYLQDASEVRWWQVLSRSGEGLVDFALLPGNTIQDLEAARLRGLDLIGPIDGGRMRTDGVRLDWQIVRPKTNDLPFWCGDVTPRHLRVPKGDMRVHANGVTGIASVRIAVSDAEASASRYEALAGSEAVSRHASHVQVALDGTMVEIAGDAEYVAQRAEGPVSLVLRGPSHATLDMTKTHGASISIAP